jgi:hypothetical protein
VTYGNDVCQVGLWVGFATVLQELFKRVWFVPFSNRHDLLQIVPGSITAQANSAPGEKHEGIVARSFSTRNGEGVDSNVDPDARVMMLKGCLRSEKGKN